MTELKGCEEQESMEQLKVAARKYVEDLSSLSSKQHKISAQLLNSAISSNSAIPERIGKLLIRSTVAACFTRLTNPHSQAALFPVVFSLVRKDPSVSFMYLGDAFTSFFKSNLPMSKWIIANSVLAAKWLFSLSSYIDLKDADVFNFFMLALLSIAPTLCASQRIIKTQRKIVIMLNYISLEKVLEWLQNHYKVMPSSGNNILALLALLPCSNKYFDFLFFFKIYTTNVFLAKCRPSPFVLAASSKIFRQIEVEIFRDEVLPVFNKSMLRCPEIAIVGLFYMLDSVTVDMSTFAVDFYKNLSGSLISSNDEIREFTSSSISLIVKHVTVSSALKGVIDGIFNTYSGSDGRITSAGQRITILETLEMVSSHGVTDMTACDMIASVVLQRLCPLLIPEVHQATAEAMWKVVVAWSKQTANAAEKLLPLFKATLKSPNRSAALKSMVTLCSVDNGTGLVSLNDDLLKIVFGIYKTRTSTSDFVAAALLLLNDKTLWGNIRQTLLKEDFCKKKFISSLSSSDILYVAKLSHWMLKNVEAEQWNEMPNVFYALFTALFWPDHEVRKDAKNLLRNCVVDKGNFFCADLLDFLFQFMISGLMQEVYNGITARNGEQNERFLDGKLIAAAVHEVMIPFDADTEDFDLGVRVLTSGLLVSCTPEMIKSHPCCWNLWIKSIKNVECLFNEKSIGVIVKRVFATNEAVIRHNAIKMLLSDSEVASQFRNCVWDYCTDLLNDIDIEQYIRITDREVAIYNTREGTLYNSAILEQSYEEEFETRNVRRENKAYQYKDQLLEAQLKKELAEKRRQEGKLTPLQEKAKKEELLAEQKVREKLGALYLNCKERLDPLAAAISADSFGSAKHVRLLITIIIPLLKSPLVSHLAFDVFRHFRNAAFKPSEDYLHELILNSSVRVLQSVYKDTAWSQESLTSQVERVVTLLTARCIMTPVMLDYEEMDGEEEMGIDDDETMNLIKFNVTFPLIDAVIRDEIFPYALRLNAMRLLASTLKGKFIKANQIMDLPLQWLGSLLLYVLSTDISELYHSAKTSLQTFCELLDECREKNLHLVEVLKIIVQCLSNENARLRECALLALIKPHSIYNHLSSTPEGAPFIALFTHRIFIAQHDPVKECAFLAKKIWDDEKLSLTPKSYECILDDVTSENAFMRNSATLALGNVLEKFPEVLESAMEKLALLYTNCREIQPPVFDEIGRIVTEPVDLWRSRAGIADALLVLAPHIPPHLVMRFIKIIVPSGISDLNSECRELMRNAAVEVIRKHGEAEMTSLLPFLEELLNSTPNDEKFDSLRQGLVIILGTLAQHLDSGNEKVRSITALLIETLSTPSQQVQEAVSKCLPALVPAISDSAKELISTLSCLLVEADSYGERRGAAYGIAGLVKGLGMSAVRELELMKFLQNSLAEKKNSRRREGALLALELLCSTMGKLFEPYIVQVLPLLLICFGDSDDNVRRAADDAARSMMAMLSAHGVKLVLPSLLAALDEESWRTKCASVELLGAMAFCAPKQLSACLPSIVPKLIEVLTDSHSKVQKSGERALKQIAKVIRNPEILSIGNHLLTGLTDPAGKTSVCLQTIVNTKFVHYIDAASLSLIMPIVRRAFVDRASETRRMAAQIIANIYSLTDNKDMEPYLADLLPGLQRSLLDPIPDIRTVASKAIGAIIACSSGNTTLNLREQLVPWLKENLVSKTSAVDRSGAAQGLAEVLKALGEDQLARVMPDIINTTESEEVTPEIRDGYILMYIYLPMAFGDHFVPYLPQIIPSILKALADETEFVRESALKAGQRLIVAYCMHARRLLLPQLQAALFDGNWRIRFAAVTLIGDFLFNVSGVSGKMTSATSDEDDTMGMESAGKAIVRQLGQACRDRVLAGIYLSRSDVAVQVRQTASHVWKIVVANTPRTLKEVMKTLFEMLLSCLASSSEDRQVMAGRCLGELVKKMGERIIIDVLPVLECGLSTQSVEQRVGVAIALREIVENSTKDIILMYKAQLVEPVKKIISDSSLLVRQAAASAFASFYQTVGISAFEEIVGPLLDASVISDDDVLDGLSHIMRLNGRQMLPYVLPKLTRPPVNVKALCTLSAVAGDSLNRNVSRILDFILDNCTTSEEIDQCLKVILSVSDEDGILVALTTLLQRVQSQYHIPSSTLLNLFAKSTKYDLSNFVNEILPRILLLYNSSVNEVVENAIETLISVCQNLDQKQQLSALSILKQTISMLHATAGTSSITGFTYSKAVSPLLPIIREAILSGSADVKEEASETLGNIVTLSTAAALKPHVVNITGPLIRVLGDRYSHNVKTSILTTLSLLLDKVDVQLRPFLPQLQSTFLKGLQDTVSRKVRLCAGGALSRLIVIHPKPELIVLELIKYLNASADTAVTETTLISLRAILIRAQSKVTNENVLQEAVKVAQKHQEKDTPITMLKAASALLGELALKMNKLTNDYVSCSEDVFQRHVNIVVLQYAACTNPQVLLEVYGIEKIRLAFTNAMQCDKPEIASSAVRGAAAILLSQEVLDASLLSSIARAINHPSNDVKCVVALGMRHIGSKTLTINELKIVVPMMLNGMKEKSSAVRAACEQALLALFRLRDQNSIYNDYLSMVEGAAREVLVDAHETLQKILKHPDQEVEPLSDIANVP